MKLRADASAFSHMLLGYCCLLRRGIRARPHVIFVQRSIERMVGNACQVACRDCSLAIRPAIKQSIRSIGARLILLLSSDHRVTVSSLRAVGRRARQS